ncbi:hypothetical protein IF188_10570 [Microbacterium sp. NEAU-LLC]|uniref:Uncharacterized protein n=1 Tax=Microbacterium helvum TaxID=2773713 RepID=A0ABR8NRD6_9MICO|nr:hypothetical protein [Microbacterium helvum]MBD3942141.1 hypothetical protein [Microbacterium helvum]
MFRTHTSVPAQLGPVSADWTIHELLTWIAADDARCHDEALRPLLSAIDASLAGMRGDSVRPASVVPLVRSIAGRLRLHPSAGDQHVSDFGVLPPAADLPVAPERAANGRRAASTLAALG